MDANTVNGILRAIVPAGLSWAVAKGYLGESAVADITAAATAVASAIWSIFSNQTTTK